MYENYAAKQASVHRAANVLHVIRQLYLAGKSTQALLADYQAGTDTALIGTVQALFTAEERTDMAALLTDLNTFVTRLETRYRAALGLPPP